MYAYHHYAYTIAYRHAHDIISPRTRYHITTHTISYHTHTISYHTYTISYHHAHDITSPRTRYHITTHTISYHHAHDIISPRTRKKNLAYQTTRVTTSGPAFQMQRTIHWFPVPISSNFAASFTSVQGRRNEKKARGAEKSKKAHCNYFNPDSSTHSEPLQGTVAYLGYYGGGGGFSLVTNAYTFM